MLAIRNLRRIEPLRRSTFVGEERRRYLMAMVSAPHSLIARRLTSRRSHFGRAIAAAGCLSEGGGVHPCT